MRGIHVNSCTPFIPGAQYPKLLIRPAILLSFRSQEGVHAIKRYRSEELIVADFLTPQANHTT
jgi:hypothetical protein